MNFIENMKEEYNDCMSDLRQGIPPSIMGVAVLSISIPCVIWSFSSSVNELESEFKIMSGVVSMIICFIGMGLFLLGIFFVIKSLTYNAWVSRTK